MSANTVSVSSEFDIFASKPIQSAVADTTEVKYKPIASVDLSELEFLIPSDDDTYIDLDIKIYIRGKLTKADGTALDNTDFTAVTKNFLHSLSRQCSIALNALTITQASELHNYLSFFETILTYGSDATTSHLKNVFCYLDNGDVLLYVLPPPMQKTKTSSRDGTVLNRAKRSNCEVEFTVISVLYINICSLASDCPSNSRRPGRVST